MDIAGWVIGYLLISILVAQPVLKFRAGVPLLGVPKVFGPDGHGLSWTIEMAVKAGVWPVTLAMWLVKGRPEARVVFNEKAEARRQSVG